MQLWKMDFVSPVITPIVESLMIPIKKHLGFLVSSTKYVRDMEEKMDQLNLTEQDIQLKKKTADANNHEVSHHVLPWLEDVQKMKENAQSIIPTSGMGCFNLAKRYKTGKQSYRVLNRIKALKERESEIEWTNEQKSLAKVSSTSTLVPHVAQNNFDSRDLVFNDALKGLQTDDETHNMIALCGMGGVGKTTMMEQLMKAVKDANMFDSVVKVVIGENTDTISIQQAIAQYIGKDLSETNKDARADRLRERFLGMSQNGKKKILVIMDDVWKEVDLKDVGLSPLPNGFRLLFTSRYEYVCTQMGVKTSSIFKVQVLNYVEAKALFFNIVGPSLLDGDNAEFQMIGEDIVKKCGGLPMAILTIAKILRGNIKEAWQKALWRLEQDDLKDLESITHSIIEMSYNNLKEDDDKSIFLLSGLFPDDFDIHLEDLLRYGWRLSSFKDVKTLAMARSHMKICVNNLIHANLLIESDRTGCVKMHDLVRAFVLSNFTKLKQASMVNYRNMSLQRLTTNGNESYKRILLRFMGKSKFPRDFNYPNLSLLILMDGNKLLKFPEDIYKRMKKLEVLSYDNMGIPLLPVSFEHTSKLRTLCIRSCSLINDEISLLGTLSNLEILSFIDCNIRRLPLALGKLKRLKLLDLTGCVDLCIDDGLFQPLSSLEELYMRASKGRYLKLTHANCDELEKLSHGLLALELEFFENKPQPKNVSFKNLERFGISIGCGLEYDENFISRNTMKLVANCNELHECNISELFEKVEELRLQVNDMNHLEDLSMRHTFFTLRDLHVSKCEDLTYLFTVGVASGLEKLERLTISGCPILKTLVGENTRDIVITFKSLKFMSLKCLPKMVSLCNNVIKLPEMVELVLQDLPEFMSIFSDNNDKPPMQSLLHKEVMIPKLEKLDISMMENLKKIWSCQISDTEKNNASMLRHITVRDCNSLINLFPCNPLPLVSNLEELTIKHCGSLEALFMIDLESVCGVREYNCRLRSIEVESSWKLKELWRIIGLKNSDIIINEFKGVEIIKIKGCKMFTNIFTPTTAKFNLRSLTTYISHNTAKDFEEKKRETTKIDVKLKGEILEMDPNVTYPHYLLHSCHHLKHLQLKSDRRVGEVVFEMDSQPPPLLPYLEILKLSYLKEMSHVWKCNWNKFLVHQPLNFPFQSLTKLHLWDCHKLKYLFSPLMMEHLSNLKRVKINDCKGIEEVISSRDDEIVENTQCRSTQKNTSIFPHLDILKLRKLPSLKSLHGGDTRNLSDKISSDISTTIHDRLKSGQATSASWSLCEYPKKIIICSCDALTSLVPWYVVENMKRIENIEIENCKVMMEVFESESINNDTNNADEGSASCVDGMSATLTSPTLKRIASFVPQLTNLKSVSIIECKLLPHIFTFSTLESLKQLKELKVKKCETIQVIIKVENGTPSKDVVFPSMKTLELDDLPNLKGFYLGMNDFIWPVLVNVVIRDCPWLMMFTRGHSNSPKLKNVCTSLGKHSLESDLNFQTTVPSWSYHNLIEINVEKTNVEKFIPSTALVQLQKLKKIRLSSCKGANEVFEVALEETNSSGFNESQRVVEIANLKKLDLVNVACLKYLWKINQLMVLEFPNLTTVSFHKCNSLEHVFTCSMVGSLLHLKDVCISECMNIEVIVKEEEIHDAKVKDNMLRQLKSFKLEHLHSLKGFCLGDDAFSLPSLDTLQINDCPAITVFTKGFLATPKLKVIETSFGMCYVHGGLNSFIKIKQEEGHAF